MTTDLLNRKIIIQTDADFTPAGKRAVRIVRRGGGLYNRYATGKRGVQMITWYVGGRIYRNLPLTAENAALSNEWVAA